MFYQVEPDQRNPMTYFPPILAENERKEAVWKELIEAGPHNLTPARSVESKI